MRVRTLHANVLRAPCGHFTCQPALRWWTHATLSLLACDIRERISSGGGRSDDRDRDRDKGRGRDKSRDRDREDDRERRRGGGGGGKLSDKEREAILRDKKAELASMKKAKAERFEAARGLIRNLQVGPADILFLSKFSYPCPSLLCPFTHGHRREMCMYMVRDQVWLSFDICAHFGRAEGYGGETEGGGGVWVETRGVGRETRHLADKGKILRMSKMLIRVTLAAWRRETRGTKGLGIKI